MLSYSRILGKRSYILPYILRNTRAVEKRQNGLPLRITTFTKILVNANRQLHTTVFNRGSNLRPPTTNQPLHTTVFNLLLTSTTVFKPAKRGHKKAARRRLNLHSGSVGWFTLKQIVPHLMPESVLPECSRC